VLESGVGRYEQPGCGSGCSHSNKTSGSRPARLPAGRLVSNGLQVGIVVDEHLAAPGQGDFLIRGLLGADLSTGAR
jgi:hypothetical protein